MAQRIRKRTCAQFNKRERGISMINGNECLIKKAKRFVAKDLAMRHIFRAENNQV